MEKWRDFNVLVADDDPSIREIVLSAVEQLGFKTAPAVDGDQAIEVCSKGLPDIAILDYMMPGASGLEVCEWIKSQSEGNSTPVLILTARDQLADKVEALQRGADDYLTKPFHIKELQARLEAMGRMRKLSLELKQKNRDLEAAKAKLTEQERQLVAGQIAGTAAHQLGQPLTALKLNCHLLSKLDKSDERFKPALESMQADLNKMTQLIKQLESVDATETEDYHRDTSILKLSELRKEAKKN